MPWRPFKEGEWRQAPSSPALGWRRSELQYQQRSPWLTWRPTFVSLKGSRSIIMTTSKSNGSIRTTSLRGYLFFVWFTGRYAYGRPETLLTN